jgi:hypothetical protein
MRVLEHSKSRVVYVESAKPLRARNYPRLRVIRWLNSDAGKPWGDALAKQDSTREALAKYDEVLKFAPNWRQLHEAREAAMRQKS